MLQPDPTTEYFIKSTEFKDYYLHCTGTTEVGYRTYQLRVGKGGAAVFTQYEAYAFLSFTQIRNLQAVPTEKLC